MIIPLFMHILIYNLHKHEQKMYLLLYVEILQHFPVFYVLQRLK